MSNIICIRCKLEKSQDCCSNISYDFSKITTNCKPSNHDRKIFNITELEDGTYIYERKKVED